MNRNIFFSLVLMFMILVLVTGCETITYSAVDKKDFDKTKGAMVRIDVSVRSQFGSNAFLEEKPDSLNLRCKLKLFYDHKQAQHSILDSLYLVSKYIPLSFDFMSLHGTKDEFERRAEMLDKYDFEYLDVYEYKNKTQPAKFALPLKPAEYNLIVKYRLISKDGTETICRDVLDIELEKVEQNYNNNMFMNKPICPPPNWHH